MGSTTTATTHQQQAGLTTNKSLKDQALFLLRLAMELLMIAIVSMILTSTTFQETSLKQVSCILALVTPISTFNQLTQLPQEEELSSTEGPNLTITVKVCNTSIWIPTEHQQLLLMEEAFI